MTKPVKPWSFEPFEIYEDRAWSILDPNLAAHIAIFFDQDEAEAYLAWRNKKQAKREAKKQAKQAKAREAAEAQVASWSTQKWS